MTASRKPLETGPSRMDALARLPIFLALEGKRAVLAGTSQAAVWKAELLSAAGAHVEVYAPQISEDFRLLAAEPPRGEVNLRPRGWRADDLIGATVAVGDFKDDTSAAAFAAAARQGGVPVNVIDQPEFCDFAFGAIVNRSPLVIGISTDGAAPVFAQAIRAKLEALLPRGFARWAVAAARWRSRTYAGGLSAAARAKFWQSFTAHALKSPEQEPVESDFENFVAEVKGLGAAAENGFVTMVGAGPGDPELLTLRAVRALHTADVILFDDLVSHDVLEFVRREAKKMLVGKTGFGPSCKQDAINALMIDLARSGKRVVRLKGGDPLIFARAAEEIAALRAANVPFEIVPGITAAQGVASQLALPLTDRDRARRVQFVTGHAKNGKLPSDMDLRSIADPETTTAIYMPSHTLTELVFTAIAEGLNPDTPAVAVAGATRRDQIIIGAPVVDLPAKLMQNEMDGPVLVMIGRVCQQLGAKCSVDRPTAIGWQSNMPTPMHGLSVKKIIRR